TRTEEPSRCAASPATPCSSCACPRSRPTPRRPPPPRSPPPPRTPTPRDASLGARAVVSGIRAPLVRPREPETTARARSRRRDDGTTRRRDDETTGRRDDETTGGARGRGQ